MATQSIADLSYGRLGLALMQAGKSAPQALAALVAADPDEDVRQVAMVDREGRVAAHTGARCIDAAHHIEGDGWSVQGNLLSGVEVVEAMAEAYSAALDAKVGDLSERLLRTLEAAQEAGGDVRGRQSAGLLVVPGPDDPLRRENPITDLRVDDSDHPLMELRRLLTVQRAYEWHELAIHDIEKGNMDSARTHYRNLRGLVVGTREPQFWYAAALAEHGHVQEALPIFAEVFQVEPVWRSMLDRLAKQGFFPDDDEIIEVVRSV